MKELMKCAECGRIIERNAPSQKFCKECAASRRYQKSKARRAQKRIEAALKQEEDPALLNTLTTKGKSVPRIIAEARAFGMTYGTYTAAIRDGSIERVLRAKGFADPEAVLRGLDIK